MKKTLCTLLIMALLACPVMAQRYRQHQVTIVDEFGDAVTNIDIITIIDVGTSNNSTIYADRAGDLTMVNPITTSSTNSTFVQSLGQVRWFQRAPGYKITVTESGTSTSLTIDNQAEGDTRFPFYANYIGAASSLNVGDDDLLNIGTSADFTHDWDNLNSRYIIASASDGSGTLHFGKAANHHDIYWHTGDITTDYVLFSQGSANVQFIDVDLLIDDEGKLLFGDSSDVTIEYDESNNDLDILSTPALDLISFGATGDGYDIEWFSTTAGDYALFDYSEDAILLEDLSLFMGEGEKIFFGDAIGTGDMFISVTSNVMEIGQVVADTGSLTFGNDDDGVDVTFFGNTASQKAWWDASGDEWFFGANAEGVDVTWYGDIASSYMKWDEDSGTNGALIFDAADIAFSETDGLLFGDTLGTGDFRIDSTSAVLTIDVVSAGNGEVAVGNDADDVPWKWYAEDTGDWVYFNALELEFEDVVVQMMDDTPIDFGDGDDVTVEYDTDTHNALLWAGAGHIGDQKVIELEASTSETVLATESGKVFITTVGQGTVTYTLPTAATGLWYTFIDASATAGDNLRITAAASDSINGGTVAKHYDNWADAIPGAVTIVAISADSWEVVFEVGTWVNNNN